MNGTAFGSFSFSSKDSQRPQGPPEYFGGFLALNWADMKAQGRNRSAKQSGLVT
jgi:hypothetical protein